MGFSDGSRRANELLEASFPFQVGKKWCRKDVFRQGKSAPLLMVTMVTAKNSSLEIRNSGSLQRRKEPGIAGSGSVFIDRVDVVVFVDLVRGPGHALFRNGLYRG